MNFDPSKHLSPARKGSPPDYLQVKWRIVWLRQEHPDASIETEKVAGGIESNYAEFKARVSIPGGGSATGYGSETKADFIDFIEKAETKAIGRAIANLGFGTQFVGNELDEGDRIVDSPMPPPAPRTQPKPAAPQPQPAAVAPPKPAPPSDDNLLARIRDDTAPPEARIKALNAYYDRATVIMQLNQRVDTVKESGLPDADLRRAYAYHHTRLTGLQPAPAATPHAGYAGD